MSHLFLTGATGLVGSEVLARALSEHQRVTCLVRRPNPPDRVASVRGDLAHFDLDPGDITAILHCAAETRFGLSLEETRRINVEGTRSLLDFARRCSRLEKFGHVSTVFTCGRLVGPLSETRWHPAAFSNTYQRSKWEAEELVFEAMRDIPAAIYRLSSIIGDSSTGAVRQFNYTHQLLRFLGNNVLPMAPGIPNAPVDLIATDWACEALFRLFLDRFEGGTVFHICAGPDRSLRVGEMIDLARRGYETEPAGQKWLPIRVPKLVSLDEYAAFVEDINRGKDRLLKETVRVLDFFLPHLAMRQEFGRVNTAQALPGYKTPDIRAFFPKMISYCLATNWGREPPVCT